MARTREIASSFTQYCPYCQTVALIFTVSPLRMQCPKCEYAKVIKVVSK